MTKCVVVVDSWFRSGNLTQRTGYRNVVPFRSVPVPYRFCKSVNDLYKLGTVVSFPVYGNNLD